MIIKRKLSRKTGMAVAELQQKHSRHTLQAQDMTPPLPANRNPVYSAVK